MSTTELARLVAEMRAAQKNYFRLRSPSALEASKALERCVDDAVRECLTQPTLPWDDDGPDDADLVPPGHKRCARCGCALPLADFHRRAASSDGLQAYCRECVHVARKGRP